MPNTRTSNEGDFQQLAGVLDGMMKPVKGAPSTAKIWTFDMSAQDKDEKAIQDWQAETMPPPSLSQEDLKQLERVLIPALNEVRRALGKKPIYIPKE